jgi:hypothetical protein
MRRRWYVGPVALALAVVLAGCSSGGDDAGRTVTPDDGGHSYVVPEGFSIGGGVEVGKSTGTVRARSGVGLNENNLILVTAFALNRDIDDVPFAALREENDRVVANLLGGTEKIQDSGTTTVAGKKALFYRFATTSTSKTPVTNETYFVFKDRLQLQIICQWTDDKKAEITSGCTSIRESLVFTPAE